MMSDTLVQALATLDEPIKALSYLIVLDVITGLIASAKRRELQSSVGTNGLFRKVGVIFCVTLTALVDKALQMTAFTEFAIAGFALVEVMSVLENIDRAGYGYILPDFLRQMFKNMYDQKVGGMTNEKTDDKEM